MSALKLATINGNAVVLANLVKADDIEIIVRTVTVNEHRFNNPDEAYSFYNTHNFNHVIEDGNYKSTSNTSIMRKSSTDMPVLDILVLDFMNKKPRKTTFTRSDLKELFARWRYAETSITPVLCRLANAGHVVRVQHGQYMLSE